MLKSRIVGLFTVIALAISTLVGVAAPASASTSDATLSSLFSRGTGNQISDVQPGFSSDRTWYQVITTREELTLNATATDAGATIHYKWGTNDDVVASGDDKTLTLPTAFTVVSLEVVASDGVTKKTYTVQVNYRVLAQPQILSITPDSGGQIGGDRIAIRVKNPVVQFWNGIGLECRTYFNFIRQDGSDRSSWNNYAVEYDNNGIATYFLNAPNFYDWSVGKVDVRAMNDCQIWDESVGWWRNMQAQTTLKNAYEYKPVVFDSLQLDKANTTPTGRFTFTGQGINSNADYWGYLEDPAHPGSYLYFWTWGFIDNRTASMYFDEMPYDMNWDYVTENWDKPGKKDIVILKCGAGDGHNCWGQNDGDAPSTIEDLTAQGNVLYKGTVDYTPDFPSMVTVSPNKGSVKGGNTIRVRGHHLYDRNEGWPVIKIGDQALTNVNRIQSADSWDPNSIEVYEGTVPEAVKAGSYPITINNHWGATTIATKYTYGAKPEITSIAPASAANSGGSLVTLTGTGFGSIGTPSVTIDGVKSPCVTRVSDTKVIAMVPQTASTGSVDVNIIAGTGGGSPDLPAKMSLVAAGTAPTISKVAPSTVAIGGGDEVVITGTGFGAAGTVGVRVGENCARVISSTATSVTFEAPSGDAAGATDIVVGSTAATLTKAGALTYAATPGVTSVVPSSIASSAVGDAAKVVINGVGFGSAGKIKVGSAAAINYSATDNGTKISGVVIPTTATGSVVIVVTPTGATTPFTTSVKVNAPKVTYFGSNPKNEAFNFATGWYSYTGGYTPNGFNSGGSLLRIEGTGFGTSGVVKFGTQSVTATTWTDTLIELVSPAIAAGTYDVVVTPSAGSGTFTITKGFISAVRNDSNPAIVQVASAVDNGRTNQAHTFDAEQDVSDVFIVTGTALAGTDNGASTKVTLVDYYSNRDVAVVPYDITATSFKFHASRDIVPVRWVGLRVVTNIGTVYQDRGMQYVGNAPQPTVFSPGSGLCTKDAIGVYSPATLSLTGPDGFGASGKVTIDGVEFPASAVDWTIGSITVRMSGQTTNLANPWGNKTVVFTPTDTSLLPRTYNFNCSVETTVTTTINGGTADVTIAAGTAYTAGASLVNPIPGTTYVPAANGYQYVKAADHASTGWNNNVQSGLPVAAGDYYVRVNIGLGTYDQVKYSRLWWDNESVHLTITGTAVTFTPKLAASAATEITYKGQLGDGTGQTSNDIAYTKTATTDAVTTIYWEYKNHTCASDNNVGWNQGLPGGVAIAPSNCGGDNTTVSSWDIRVRGFDMVVNGVNRNIFYIPTYNIFNLKINKKSLTISKVTAEKVYNGDANINLSEITVTGAIDGETPYLDGQNSQGTFADATAGTGKSISLGGDLKLAGQFNSNYVLTNPNIVFTGTIKKADASLRLTPSVSSVIMTNVVPVDITVTNKDTRTNQAPAVEAGASAIVVTSGTTSVCTYAAGVVTVLKAGDCVINASQAASANYNAAKSYQDDSLTVESITIKVFAAPKTVQVVADDVSVALGDSVNPSAQAIGLVEGDELGSVVYDYYQGATLLSGAPTEAGTYKIVPRDANLTAADMSAYVSTFKYVAGKLIITQVPPVFTAVTPAHGPEAGKNTVVISGERLGDVTSILIGTKTLRKTDFVVNGDGTEISFKAPAGKGQVDLILRAGNAEAPGFYVYDAPVVPVVTAPLTLSLDLKLEVGVKLVGQKITISGGGLKALSDYTLVMRSTPITIYKGVADANGNFVQIVTMPGKACVASGEHTLTLTGIKPDGGATTAKASFRLSNDCLVEGGSAVKNVVKGKVTWTLSGFLFKYRDERLTAAGLKSLDGLIKNIKGAKIVKIYGYTETDTKSAVIKKANLILAKARTETVRKYLLSKGIVAKFYTYGKGGVNPISLVNQAQNRRVVIDASF